MQNIVIIGLILLISCEKKSSLAFSSQLSPTKTPKLFFSGSVSLRNTVHYNSSFSDDGKVLVNTQKDSANRSVASYQLFKNNTFTKPTPISESPHFAYVDPHISSDGKTVILSSNRSLNNDTIWSEPKNLGKQINSHGYDGSPYLSTDQKWLILTSSRHPEKKGEQEKFNIFYVSFDVESYK